MFRICWLGKCNRKALRDFIPGHLEAHSFSLVSASLDVPGVYLAEAALRLGIPYTLADLGVRLPPELAKKAPKIREGALSVKQFTPRTYQQAPEWLLKQSDVVWACFPPDNPPVSVLLAKKWGRPVDNLWVYLQVL